MIKLLLNGTLILAAVSVAQNHLPQAGQPIAGNRTRHTGRIIRSFTEPYLRSVAASPVSGIVAEVVSQEGDRVGVGDPLAILNCGVLEATLEIARARATGTARLDATRIHYELVKAQLETLHTLKDSGHANRYELDQKNSEFQKALAEFRSAEEAQLLARLEVKRIEAELKDRTIQSPIDGFVIEIHKQRGEHLSSTEPHYATVVSLKKLRVRFYVGAVMLHLFKPGTVVAVDLGKERKPVSAIVSFVSPTIDADSGVGRLEVLIENSDLKFQSGTTAILNEAATQQMLAKSTTGSPQRH